MVTVCHYTCSPWSRLWTSPEEDCTLALFSLCHAWLEIPEATWEIDQEIKKAWRLTVPLVFFGTEDMIINPHIIHYQAKLLQQSDLRRDIFEENWILCVQANCPTVKSIDYSQLTAEWGGAGEAWAPHLQTVAILCHTSGCTLHSQLLLWPYKFPSFQFRYRS